MEQKQKEINDFLEACLAENKKEDAIFTELAEKTGQGIISAIRTYKHFLKLTGRVISPEQRKEKIRELVIRAAVEVGEGDEAYKVITDLKSLVESIKTEVELSEHSALANVNKIAEALSIKLPEKSKSIGLVNKWLIDNRDATRDEFSDWMKEQGKSAGNTASYWSKLLFARTCFIAWNK